MTEPLIIAHAGASGHAPANTLGAYRRAHATYPGCWMEFDAQFSKDDQLVAIHDDTLDRTTFCTGPVSDKTADELAECNATKGYEGWDAEPVHRVRTILEEGRKEGWRIICEVKNIPGQKRFDPTGESYGEALVNLIADVDFPLDRLVVICFWHATLDAIKKRNEGIALGFLSVPELPNGMVGLTAAQNAELCLEHGFHVSAPTHTTPDLTAEHIADCNAKGLQVQAWTLNTKEAIEAGVAKGLNGITSDYPELVYEALGKPL